MAKVSFTKLGLKRNDEIKTFEFNGQEIEVKQYLPIEKKLELIGRVIELSHDQNNFSNPLKIKAYLYINIVEYYTNINFTEKQKEDIPKLYDLICGSELINNVLENISNDEINELTFGLKDTVEAVYKYRNSILGILDSIKQDYDNLNLNMDEIYEKITDPEAFNMLKDIVNLDQIN